MIRVSNGLGALTTPEQHDAFAHLLIKSFGRGAAKEVIDSMAGMRQYFFFKDNVPVAVLSVRGKGILHCTDTPRANVIYNAATAPGHRRKGHMRKLLTRVIADYRRKGKRHLNLEVLADNKKALCLYASVGFEVAGVCDNIVHMRRHL